MIGRQLVSFDNIASISFFIFFSKMPPKKSKEPLTDDEKFQQQLGQEAELARLQRKYEILQTDRLQQLTGGGKKSHKVDKIISIFSKEHENIKTDLGVAGLPEKKKEDEGMTEKVAFLMAEYDQYNDNVEAQRTYMKEIEGQIRMVKTNVLKLRSKQITDRQYEDRVWNAMKILEALENKLEVQVRKFCAICTRNRELREQIDHYLYERQSLMKMWNKLLEKLTVGKQILMDLIEQATIAYDQREEWCTKLQALRIKGHRDLLQHTQKMTVFQRKEDNNVKLEEFLDTKGQKRVMRDLEANEKLRRAEQQAKVGAQLEQYQKMLKDIKVFCNETKIDKIAKQFYQQDEENFMLFKYVNDLNLEMESVNDNLGYLHLDIDQKKVLHEIRSKQQTTRLEEIEKELETKTKETQQSEKQHQKFENFLNNLMQGIGNLFKICKCKNDPILKLLGDHSKIQFYNVLLILEILENKIHEIMLITNYKDRTLYDRKKITSKQKVIQPGEPHPKIFTSEELVTFEPCPLCVEREMVGDVIDSLQFVWDRKTAKENLKERMKQPDSGARLHRVSKCHLPKSREIIQRRYQL